MCKISKQIIQNANTVLSGGKFKAEFGHTSAGKNLPTMLGTDK